MDILFVLLVLLVGILLGLVEGKSGHLVLRLACHRGIQLLVRKEIVQVHVANHGSLQKVLVPMLRIGVVAHKHVSRGTYQYGHDVNGAEQRSKQHATVHTVYLRGLQRIVERADTLRENHIAG